MQTATALHREAMKYSDRIFFSKKGKRAGATVVFFAGIHGNERAGVDALNNLIKQNTEIKNGKVYGILGNIKALAKEKRFIDEDLNRMWLKKRLIELETKLDLNAEEHEQKALFTIISDIIIENGSNPIYFIDLHTTSSKTLPFITINDAMINRKFSRCFPVPIVLGIEEYLNGPLLSYLNTKGFVSLGFESGQHYEAAAITNCEAFIFLVLNTLGLVSLPESTKNDHLQTLKQASNNTSSIFEVVYKHHIQPNEVFKMNAGYTSFQNVTSDMHLGHSNGRPLYANYNAKLFMPLYQNSGNDGYFIIRQIPEFFLALSKRLRQIKADALLTWLPGISWYDKKNGVLKADLNIARFMAKSVFHLLGYRNKQEDSTHILLYNRERVAKNKMYKNEVWY